MHREKLKEKKKKKKKQKKKKRGSDSSDSEEEDEEKKKQKLNKVNFDFFALICVHACVFMYMSVHSHPPTSPLPPTSLSPQALAAEDVRLKQVEEMMKVDERKRKYNSLQEIKEPTEEEMEAFRMKRSREDDPMANFLELGQ